MTNELLCLTAWSESFIENVVNATSRSHNSLYIVEDSEHMTVIDGTRLIRIDDNVRFEECSRWEELSAMLGMVAALSKAANTSSQVRFLNTTTESGSNLGTEDSTYIKLLPRLAAMPLTRNQTPLCRQIGMVAEELLQSNNNHNHPSSWSTIVLLVGSIPTDGDVLEALALLSDLPVQILVKIYGNDSLYAYWQDVAMNTDIEIQVMGTLSTEAHRVKQVNPWLSYAEPLHRIREMGLGLLQLPVLHTVAKRKLSQREVRELIDFLLLRSSPSSSSTNHNKYNNTKGLVEDDDWMSYLTMVAHAINTQPLVCCPCFPCISSSSSSSSSSTSWPFSPQLPSLQLSPPQRSTPQKQVITLPPSPHFCPWVDMKELVSYDDDTLNEAIKHHESVLWGLYTCYAFNAPLVRIAPSQIAQSKLLASPVSSHSFVSSPPSLSSFSPIPTTTTPIPPPPPPPTTTTTTTSPIVRFPPIHSRGSPMKYEKKLLGVDHCWQLLEDLRLVPTLLNTIRFQHLLTIITTSNVVIDTIGENTMASSQRLNPVHTSSSIHSPSLHHHREIEGSLPVGEYKPNHIHNHHNHSNNHLHCQHHPHNHEDKYKSGGTSSNSSALIPMVLCFREFIKLLMMIADVGYSKTHPYDRNAQFHELMHRIYASHHFKRLLLLGVGVVAEKDSMREDVDMGRGQNKKGEDERKGTHLGSEMDVVALSHSLSSNQSNHQSNPVAVSQPRTIIDASMQADHDEYGDGYSKAQSLMEHPSSVSTPNHNHHHHHHLDNHIDLATTTNLNNTTVVTSHHKLLLSPEERLVLSRLRFTIDPYATRNDIAAAVTIRRLEDNITKNTLKYKSLQETRDKMMVLYQDALNRIDELTDQTVADQHTMTNLRQHIAKVEENEADLVRVHVVATQHTTMLEERALEFGAIITTLRQENEQLLYAKTCTEEEVRRLSFDLSEQHQKHLTTTLTLDTTRITHENELIEREQCIRALQSSALVSTAELGELRRLVQELSANGAVLSVQSEAQIATLTEQSKIGHDTMSTLRTQLVDSQNHVKQQQEEISEFIRIQNELNHQLRHTQQEVDMLQRRMEDINQSHGLQLTESNHQLTEERQALTLMSNQLRDQQMTIRTMEEIQRQNEIQLLSLQQHGQITDQELIEKRKEISSLRASLADKEDELQTQIAMSLARITRMETDGHRITTEMQIQHVRDLQQVQLDLKKEQEQHAVQCAQYEEEIRLLRGQSLPTPSITPTETPMGEPTTTTPTTTTSHSKDTIASLTAVNRKLGASKLALMARVTELEQAVEKKNMGMLIGGLEMAGSNDVNNDDDDGKGRNTAKRSTAVTSAQIRHVSSLLSQSTLQPNHISQNDHQNNFRNREGRSNSNTSSNSNNNSSSKNNDIDQMFTNRRRHSDVIPPLKVGVISQDGLVIPYLTDSSKDLGLGEKGQGLGQTQGPEKGFGQGSGPGQGQGQGRVAALKKELLLLPSQDWKPQPSQSPQPSHQSQPQRLLQQPPQPPSIHSTVVERLLSRPTRSPHTSSRAQYTTSTVQSPGDAPPVTPPLPPVTTSSPVNKYTAFTTSQKNNDDNNDNNLTNIINTIPSIVPSVPPSVAPSVAATTASINNNDTITSVTSPLAAVFRYEFSEPIESSSIPPPRPPFDPPPTTSPILPKESVTDITNLPLTTPTTTTTIIPNDNVQKETTTETIQEYIAPSERSDITTATTDMAVSLIHASNHSRLIALQAVNTTLTHIANDPLLQQHLQRPLVLRALACWEGDGSHTQVTPSELTEITSDIGVIALYPFIKEYERRSLVAQIPFSLDIIRRKEGKLPDSLVLSTFGPSFLVTYQQELS